jgi:fatty-acyl-CoA synthase
VSALDDLATATAHASPGRAALVWTGGVVTWSELDALAGRLADNLSAVVGRGQRVGIVSPNAPALVAALLATWRMGAVAVPLNVRWRVYELERVLKDAELAAMVTVASHRGYDLRSLVATLQPSLPTLRRVLVVDPSGHVTSEALGQGNGTADPLEPEIAALLYTSGTTGEPKGVLVTHGSEVDGASAMAEVLGTAPHDPVALVVPITHAFGLTTCFAALGAGAVVVLVESSFSLAPLVDAIGRHRPAVLHGSPTLFAGLQKLRSTALRSLRTGFVAGAPCPGELLRALDAQGLQLLNLYGMTEIGGASSCRHEDPAWVRHTTVGRPLQGYTFRTHGGSEGEVQVRSAHVTPGYYRRPEETRAAFDDGWFRTGDLGSIDADGNLRICGRAKDVIQVAGLNVIPAEVEGLLTTHPDVEHAAVIGVAHPVMGEALQAFVVPRSGSGLSPRDVLQFARARIAGYKLPYSIRMLPEIPLLPSGKVDRAGLASLATEGAHVVVR